MLIASRLVKSFSSERVLKAVNFSLAPGELVGLIGVSGSGKTVLARCLTGLESFDSGEVRLDSVIVGPRTEVDAKILASVRRSVGFVAQNRALPPYRTVIDQVAEGPRYVLQLSRKLAYELAEGVLADFGLAEHLRKFPHELSGGQLSRVCLARALVMRPGYLICDEVTANLDPVRAAEVSRALLKIVKAGIGVLFISHQIEFIRQFSARVDYFESGEIVASGSPSDIFGGAANQRLSEFLSSASLGR